MIIICYLNQKLPRPIGAAQMTFVDNTMPYKDIAKELVILLSLSIFVAFAVNLLSPNGIALFGEWDTSKGVITAKSKNDVVVRELEIQDVDQVQKIHASGAALFLDARDGDFYNDGHIEGAISFPVNRFDELILQFKKDYPPSTWIVTYCSGRECEDSHELAQYLFEEGYTQISVFIDGYPGWLEKGYPIEE